ncbi:hypothetical protein BD410DRAFT_785697 [Rickenella mellea]|uniref:BTB domain-containing protein n=1 Tax=Rickenella mellea TaxID=50990 RepID=A0A4Y7QBZ7_9AGAM|nr:hypothetical protein BD410DRAFT_785697 [Rickenella mellea]
MAVDTKCAAPLRPLSTFVPRPFPPPSLANVPVDFIVDRLHHLAVHYWDKPETADCTIIVPIVPGVRGKTTRNARPSSPISPTSMSPPLSSKSPDPAGLGRRATEPALRRISRITSKLHIDYLSAQSTLLRGLFSGTSPLGLVTPPTPTSPTSPAPRPPKPSVAIAASRMPRFMPSSSAKPVVYLPLPDPSSFPHLMHYMYFGTTSYIEECLNRQAIRWEGVVRNVEYLGMRNDIKVFLGRWYANWLAPSHLRLGSHCRPPCVYEEDEGSDSDSDSDSDSGSDCESIFEMDMDGVDDELNAGVDADAEETRSVVSVPESVSDEVVNREVTTTTIILSDPPRGRPLKRRSAIIPTDAPELASGTHSP